MLQLFKDCVGNHPNAEATYDFLKDMYLEGYELGNEYHNWDHIANVIRELAPYAIGKPLVFLAAFFHDCIYAPGAKDNEELSAAAAYDMLSSVGVGIKDREIIRDYIIATKHDVITDDVDLQYLLDSDLAGLGYSWSKYLENNIKIRKEFGKFNNIQWIAGRSKFIEGMLLKKRIFQSEPFFKKYENAARENLRTELGVLLLP